MADRRFSWLRFPENGCEVYTGGLVSMILGVYWICGLWAWQKGILCVGYEAFCQLERLAATGPVQRIGLRAA